MTRKKPPPDPRNLVKRGGVYYYERILDGRRVRRSTGADNLEEAAAWRDLYEQRRAERRARASAGAEAPFADLADRYLREATAHLAPSTLEDRERLLGTGEDGDAPGELRRYFGALRIADVTRARLLEWWYGEVEGRGRSERTGLAYLSALSGVLGYAVDLELLAASPVDALRGTLRRRRRTKRGRAAAERDSIRPLETPEELRRFMEASRAAWEGRFRNGRRRRERSRGHVADLLMLDAGLRIGEVAGLRWQDVSWGEGPDDLSRALVVREAVARGKHEGATKSGRTRRVALSRRLRGLLLEHYLASGRPAASERVLPGFRQRNYQGRHFEAVLEDAKLPHHTPKDLRDTFASQLLTAGVQLGYISAQLGHADVATTARHYARWAGGDGYRQALELAPGETAADLLVRIEALAEGGGVEIPSPHRSPHPGSEAR